MSYAIGEVFFRIIPSISGNRTHLVGDHLAKEFWPKEFGTPPPKVVIDANGRRTYEESAIPDTTEAIAAWAHVYPKLEVGIDQTRRHDFAYDESSVGGRSIVNLVLYGFVKALKIGPLGNWHG